MVNVNYYFVSTIEENMALVEEYLDSMQVGRCCGSFRVREEEVLEDIVSYVNAEFGDDVVVFEVMS